MEKTLRVKYSDFESNLSFNEWAKLLQVSTLARHEFEPYYKKLDDYNEEEKRQMIRSVYEMELPKEEFTSQKQTHKYVI
jgi:CRISPR/Cas system-associated endoribonuclease Cas2